MMCMDAESPPRNDQHPLCADEQGAQSVQNEPIGIELAALTSSGTCRAINAGLLHDCATEPASLPALETADLAASQPRQQTAAEGTPMPTPHMEAACAERAVQASGAPCAPQQTDCTSVQPTNGGQTAIAARRAKVGFEPLQAWTIESAPDVGHATDVDVEIDLEPVGLQPEKAEVWGIGDSSEDEQTPLQTCTPVCPWARCAC